MFLALIQTIPNLKLESASYRSLKKMERSCKLASHVTIAAIFICNIFNMLHNKTLNVEENI